MNEWMIQPLQESSEAFGFLPTSTNANVHEMQITSIISTKMSVFSYRLITPFIQLKACLFEVKWHLEHLDSYYITASVNPFCSSLIKNLWGLNCKLMWKRLKPLAWSNICAITLQPWELLGCWCERTIPLPTSEVGCVDFSFYLHKWSHL